MNDNQIEIVFQDEWLVAINKPAGLLVHRTNLDRHNDVAAVQLLRDKIGRRVYPVHRLDRPSSGVLLFAFCPQIVARIQQTWGSQCVKLYQALVRGWIANTGMIDYALKYVPDKIAEKDKAQNVFQDALSLYSPLKRFTAPFAVGRYSSARYSLIQLQLYTGRKHQLRRHMAHIRHPIVGDTTHGDGAQNRAAREHLACHGLALSCVRLQFVHPVTQQLTTIDAPVAPHIERAITLLLEVQE